MTVAIAPPVAPPISRALTRVSGQQTPQEIFGSIFYDLIEADLGVATSGSDVVSLTTRTVGTTLPAPQVSQRPVYGTDGSNFLGRNVIKCALTNNKLLQRLAGSDLIASGKWLYMGLTWRSAAAPGAQNWTPLNMWNVSGSDLLRITHFSTSMFGVGSNQADGPTFGSTAFNDQNQHFTEVWLKSPGHVMLAIDGGAPITLATTLGGATPRAVSNIAIGRQASNSATGATIHFGAGFICVDTPSDVQRALGRRWMQINWGAP